MNDYDKEMKKARAMLVGKNLSKTLAARGTNKWRLHRATGIAYQTLWNWQTGATTPSDESVILVSTYLGLIKVNITTTLSTI